MAFLDAIRNLLGSKPKKQMKNRVSSPSTSAQAVSRRPAKSTSDSACWAYGPGAAHHTHTCSGSSGSDSSSSGGDGGGGGGD